VVLLPIGILRGDDRVHLYALPLVVIGLGIAGYHNLLYYGVIPQSLSPCTAGAACNARQIDWLGFIGIPLLGLGSFVFLLVTLLMHGRSRTGRTPSQEAST
jgi:disulfide bond formation protein DsbB